MATHTLILPSYHPARLNDLLGCHWAEAGRRKRADRQVVGLYAKLQGIPPATGKRRVSLVITLSKGQRAGDPDCWWKSTLDALCQCGMLIDDNRQHVELGTVEFLRGKDKSTAIVLTDLDTEPGQAAPGQRRRGRKPKRGQSGQPEQPNASTVV